MRDRFIIPRSTKGVPDRPNMNHQSIQIARRRIGPGEPPYLIAEMSANHRQDFSQAEKILRAAAESGADAVKLQTYTPDTLTIDCDKPPFQIQGTLWAGRTLYELYGEAFTPWEWQPRLKRLADRLGLDLFSTPFDPTAVDFLEAMDVPAHKIASFEIVDLPLLRRVAQTGKPIVMSTGMAALAEIEEAVETIRRAGGEQLALLKCTSAYPASPHEMNLRSIPHLAETFGVPAGLSDHSLGEAVAVAAVALGACIVEKHLTLSRLDGGPDAAFSLEPREFRRMADSVRAAHEALGTVSYGPGPREIDTRRLRRSLFVVQPIASGEPFTERNIRSIRPGDGLHTRYLGGILGRRARRDLEQGTPLDWSHVE